MNTPAHIVLNLLCLGRRDEGQLIAPVIIGAILPDAPMFVFYFVEKVLRNTPESLIWSKSYFEPHWQNFIDLFNSVLLILVGLLLSLWGRSPFGTLLFASMLLHIAGDLPLHNEDAHRHFFPFSNWRFHSPVSYWDPRYYGNVVSAIEILAVIVSSFLLYRGYETWLGKGAIATTGFLYLAYFGYVFAVWM